MSEKDELGKSLVEAAENDEEKSSRGSFASTLKSWGFFIASFAALVASLASIFKPQDHTVTQVSYEEVSKTLQKLTDQGQMNHDDIVAIRQYIADQSKQPIELPSQAASAPSLRPLVRPPPPQLHSFVRTASPPPFAEVLTAAKK